MFGLVACRPDPQTAIDDATVTTESAATDLALNDGQQWRADPATVEGIRNMRKLVDSFSAPEDPEAYPTLRSALEIELVLLLQQGTMEGAAREQLQIFLAALREEFEGLSATDLAAQKRSLTAIAAQLARFDTYFSAGTETD
jgi:hypothetical protein